MEPVKDYANQDDNQHNSHGGCIHRPVPLEKLPNNALHLRAIVVAQRIQCALGLLAEQKVQRYASKERPEQFR